MADNWQLKELYEGINTGYFFWDKKEKRAKYLTSKRSILKRKCIEMILQDREGCDEI
jgi:hypothetical protein